MERDDVNLRPLKDCVLVKLDEQKDYATYKGYKHVVIPDTFSHGPEDRTPWGKVCSLGQSCSSDLKRGDHVVFGKWSYSKLYPDKQLVMVREYDILAKEV